MFFRSVVYNKDTICKAFNIVPVMRRVFNTASNGLKKKLVKQPACLKLKPLSLSLTDSFSYTFYHFLSVHKVPFPTQWMVAGAK